MAPYQSNLIHKLVNPATRLIDTELVFKLESAGHREIKTEVRFLNRCDANSFVSLQDEFRYSRFFLDDRIPDDRAKALWKESIINHCKGRADRLAVAFMDGQPAGIAALHFKAGGCINLFFVGVLSQYRNRGVGTDLLEAIAGEYCSSHHIFVETSSQKEAAIRFYQKCGFEYHNMRYIFHRMNKETRSHDKMPP